MSGQAFELFEIEALVTMLAGRDPAPLEDDPCATFQEWRCPEDLEAYGRI